MKTTLLKKNIFVSAIVVIALTVVPNLASAQYYDYGSTYDSYYDYGSTYDSYYDYGSTYDSYYDYGSTYDSSYDYGSTYDNSYSYGSTYDNYYDYGSTYDSYYDYGSTYDDYYDNYYDYGSTYDSYYDYGSTYDDLAYNNWYDYPDYSYDYPYDYGYDDYGYSYNYPYDYDYGYNYGYDDYCYDDCYSYNPPCYDCEPPCYDCEPPCYDCDEEEDLEVECVANPRNAEEGERITWRAYVEGGDGRYTYSWSEDVSGNSSVEYETYNREGIYYGTVRVRSGDGQTATAQCSVRIEEEEEDDLDVVCEYSPSRPQEGDRVTFTADVEGGNSPFDYDWSGDVNGDDRSVSKRFDRSGRYEVEIEVRDDDGNRASDTCSFTIRDEDDDDTNVNITSTPSLPTPTGTPASLSSVYLSQVPYTGPEDVLKFSLWGIALALFSIVSVREYKKHSYNKAKRNRIEAFKEENKSKIAA